MQDRTVSASDSTKGASMSDSQVHVLGFIIESGLFAGIVLTLVWIGSMKTKIDTMWQWYSNELERGKRLKLKDED